MPKLVCRVKLVAELQPGVTTETEVACLERGEEAGLADLGLRLAEAKQITAGRGQARSPRTHARGLRRAAAGTELRPAPWPARHVGTG